LHRWCQWISREHPAGVYAGEHHKSADYAASLPPFLMQYKLAPALQGVERAVVLAEEWQTAAAVLHLDRLLRRARLRERVSIFWNANNTFGFEHIDWPGLRDAATIVTVSRYMKHCMRAHGVEAVVIPNGLGPESFTEPDADAVRELRGRVAGRLLLAKVARWDPDKRRLLAIDTLAELKREGARPLLVARGGIEAHERQVIERAQRVGVNVAERQLTERGGRGLVRALGDASGADMIVLRSHLDPDARGVLFRAADAVLANSSHEPFGLVGLEAMAVGGLACTGASGEDYAQDGHNALVLHQNDPREFVSLFARMRGRAGSDRDLRQSGVRTARRYAWRSVMERSLLPRI
jgi:glycosyltransferase involved in cell wall biosynthesis